MSDYIVDNIRNAAVAAYERHLTSRELFATAEQQRSSGMSISADFTECIAQVVKSYEEGAPVGSL